MLVKHLTLPTPAENILYDEVLLLLAEASRSGETLRFWESAEPFIVLGRIGRAEDDLKADAVKREKIPVLRRASGGGTVVQGPGCLNYTLVLKKDRSPDLINLKKSYQWILGKVVAALKKAGIESAYFPISDIALAANRRKFSGNAQKRGRTHILHHGTILYSFDLPLIERYLRFPKDIPVYRNNRSHEDFVTNIPLSSSEIAGTLAFVFDAKERSDVMTAEEGACLQKLFKTRPPEIRIAAGPEQRLNSVI